MEISFAGVADNLMNSSAMSTGESLRAKCQYDARMTMNHPPPAFNWCP